jgi:outer membrane protein
MLRARQSVRQGTFAAQESRYDFSRNTRRQEAEEKMPIANGMRANSMRSLKEADMKQSFRLLLGIAAAVAASAPACAQSAGSNIVQLGWFHFDTHDSSDPLTFSQPALGPVPGSGAAVGSANTVGLAYTRFFSDNFALTFDIGAPPKFDLDGKGSLAGLGHVGSAHQWSPALVAKWFFGGAEDRFRPYVGVGATYVWYSDVHLSPSLVAQVTGGAPGGSASADIGSSWSPIANLGAVYNIDRKWSLGLSVSYIWLDADADITGKVGNAVVTRSHTRLTLDPLVTFLSVGYRF